MGLPLLTTPGSPQQAYTTQLPYGSPGHGEGSSWFGKLVRRCHLQGESRVFPPLLLGWRPSFGGLIHVFTLSRLVSAICFWNSTMLESQKDAPSGAR